MSIHSRSDLPLARRVVIKAGTSVVSTPDGYPSLSRMANIVEHASMLSKAGKEVIIVTSGAVGVGRQKLRKQTLMQRSMSDLISQQKETDQSGKGRVAYNSACAAAGQLGLMALYETMFSSYDVATSQLLVTAFDFTSEERRRNVQHVISQLLSLGIVPLINENDAVSANQGYEIYNDSFSDNDGLAAMVSIELSAQLLILLTDVKGVYDRCPTDPKAKLIDVFNDDTGFKVGKKSLQGRGGMGAKVNAALRAVSGGVQAVVIAAGGDHGVVEKITSGDSAGTLFLGKQSGFGLPRADSSSEISVAGSDCESNTESVGNGKTAASTEMDPTEMAKLAREGGRKLKTASSETRKSILLKIADAVMARKAEILAVNARDVKAAVEAGIKGPPLKRLSLTPEKIDVLCDGIRAIANDKEPLGKVLGITELAKDLVLEKKTCPIGVLMIIFESRPDCLPQIASLAIKSGNGLLLKGGKEAKESNELLHSIITAAIEEGSKGELAGTVIGLVSGRSAIPALLQMDEYIDLVIPRGSNDLVQFIKNNTKIPVMGHADGICHIYVDAAADLAKAESIVVDAKIDYPSACNAVETVLLHTSLVPSGKAEKVLRALRSAGVTLYGGPRAHAEGLTDRPADDLHKEYGDLSMAVELVGSMEEAVDHIHKYGSGHTESIITEDTATAENFLNMIDSACVFHNASTRFADGYRFGLGAEVGIATGRIHARGPVGVQGLLTEKWVLRSTTKEGYTVGPFTAKNGTAAKYTYTHKKRKRGEDDE